MKHYPHTEQELQEIDRDLGVGMEDLRLRDAYADLLWGVELELCYPFAGEEDATELQQAACFYEGAYHQGEAIGNKAVQVIALQAVAIANAMAERAESLG